MELSPSWEAANCVVSQVFSRNLWNPEVYYRVHDRHPLVPILSQINPVHTIPFHISKIYFNIIHTTPLVLPSGFLPSGFPTNILYIFISPHWCYVPCPSHPPWFENSNYNWRRVWVMKLLNTQFFPTSCHFISLGPCSQTPSVYNEGNDYKCRDCELNGSLRHRKSVDLSENYTFYKKIGAQKLICNRDFVGRIQNVTFAIGS
jgi:hypothetical protein